ncbi:nuclease-related domain-containing protein [Actinocorallia sp. B10E7]|uniref:nuclease-related domain-containing protein n=1 Tax=Actinocorallia sp. B10E7 TaxID=3153558 RepID=UPI00325E0E45
MRSTLGAGVRPVRRSEAGTAGASAWARYRRFSFRTERFVVSVVLGAAGGAVVAGLLDWRLGLAAGVALFAAHYLSGYFSPGVETDWRRGARAERRTGRDLARLGGGYSVLHDRAVPQLPTTNLDHLVIGLTGVYAVITRRVRRGARVWTDEEQLWVGEQPASGLETATVTLAAELVAEILSEELDGETDVVPVIAIQSGRLVPEGIEYGDVTFLRGRSIPGFIKSHPVIFTTAQVTTITAAAERLFPPMRWEFLQRLPDQRRRGAGGRK